VLAALGQALRPRCAAFDVPSSASRLVTLRSAQALLGAFLFGTDGIACSLRGSVAFN
jgi:hypothetical protein